MPPKKTTKRAGKKSAGKKAASKKSRKSPKSTTNDKIKSIQEGTTFAIDKAGVAKIFRAALSEMGMSEMSVEGDLWEKLLELVQNYGVNMAKRAYMIDKHKDKNRKTISGDAIELAYSVSMPNVVDKEVSDFVNKSPHLKGPQLARLIKAAVPLRDDGDYMKVSKSAKEQLGVILTIYLFELAKNAAQFTKSAHRKRISTADLEEAVRITL